MSDGRLYVEVAMVIAGIVAGSIPSGLLVAAMLGGGDLRRTGSGNIGATNALRVLGKKGALFTLIGDMAKGAIPVALARFADVREVALLLIGLGAIVGHIYSLFLRFRGGKGVATSFGVFLALSPAIALTCLVIWSAAVYFGRYSSVGALTAFSLLPVVSWLWTMEINVLLFAVAVSLLVCWQHKENIHRLRQGLEKPIR